MEVGWGGIEANQKGHATSTRPSDLGERGASRTLSQRADAEGRDSPQILERL